MFASVALWPRVKKQLFAHKNHVPIEKPNEQASEEPIPTSNEVDKSITVPPLDSLSAFDENSEKSVAEEPQTNTTQDEEKPETSAIEIATAAGRKELDAAKSDFESFYDRVELDDIQEYGAEEWNAISEIIAQAQKIVNPTDAAQKYKIGLAELKKLHYDVPNRRLLTELTQLKVERNYSGYLKKLSATWQRKDLQPRLQSYWQEVDRWNEQDWLKLIKRECKDIAPDDNGFADVYHAIADLEQELGLENRASESDETAWNNAFRMTNPIRASESAWRSLQRYGKTHSYEEVAPRANRVAVSLMTSVNEPYEQMKLFSEIGCISRKPEGNLKTLSLINKIDNGSKVFLQTYWKKIYECKIYAEQREAREIFSICATVPKYNGSRGFDPFSANTMSYGYAAVAAARTKNQSAFWEAMLLADSQQLDSTGVELRDQVAQTALVSADLRNGNIRRAVFTAMNLTDQNTRAKTLLPILAEHPESLPAFYAPTLYRDYGDFDQGCVALSKAYPELLASLGGREELVEWIFGLPQTSVRIAALTAMARHHLVPRAPINRAIKEPSDLDPVDFRNLLQNAETDAALLQSSSDRAWAYLWIAFCWKKLDQPASYQNALEKSNDAITSCWSNFWSDYTAPRRRNYGRRYGVRREHVPALNRITNYYLALAELQAFELDDPRRSVENAINAVRSTHPLNDSNLATRARVHIITDAIYQACGFRQGTMESAYRNNNTPLYFKTLLMARKGDRPGTLSALKELQAKCKANKHYQKTHLNGFVRGIAELALLCAKEGSIDDYRAYRRMALGNIETGDALKAISLVLYQADAFAGEFNLAKKSLNGRENFLPLFGPSAKVSATLCSQLSLASRTEDAIKLLPSGNFPYFRIQAMHSIAACRSKSLPKEQLLEWVNSLNEMDRIAAICGLAYPNPEPIK